MARYQIPPDPRKDEATTQHAYKAAGRTAKSSPPWLWIGLGAIVTVLAIAVAILWARLLLNVKPVDVEETPTIIIQTAVPTLPSTVATQVPDSEPVAVTETPLVDVTGEPAAPEAPTAVPAGEIGVGVRVTVTGTGGAGVSLRAGPGTDNARVGITYDNETLEVIGGPEIGDGFTWWFVRAGDGTEAWVVEDYLQVP